MQAVVENNMSVLKFLLSRGATLDAGIETRRARALSQCQLRGVGRAATRREVDEQTLEDWCRLIIESHNGYDVQIARYRRAPMIQFLVARARPKQLTSNHTKLLRSTPSAVDAAPGAHTLIGQAVVPRRTCAPGCT